MLKASSPRNDTVVTLIRDKKREKVKSKSKAKSPPPSDISSSDISDSSSDEEINMITKNLDGKTKLFITKLMEDLECPNRARI